jgi:hypothetical protein
MTQLVEFPVTKIKGSSPKLQATQYENNQRKNKTAFHVLTGSNFKMFIQLPSSKIFFGE